MVDVCCWYRDGGFVIAVVWWISLCITCACLIVLVLRCCGDDGVVLFT